MSDFESQLYSGLLNLKLVEIDSKLQPIINKQTEMIIEIFNILLITIKVIVRSFRQGDAERNLSTA